MASPRKGNFDLARRLTKKELNALIKILADCKVSWSAIWLFGSTAQGLAGPDSDRDFLVVVPDGLKKNVSQFQCDVNVLAGLRGYNYDILLRTEKDFDQNKLSPIIHEVRK
jgi:predicted nucleotidyltransferase